MKSPRGGRLWWQLKGLLRTWAEGNELGDDFFSDLEVQSLANEIKKMLVKDGWTPPRTADTRVYGSLRDYDDGSDPFR